MIPRPVIIITSAMLLLATLSWPYAYYEILRLVVCPVTTWAAVVAFGRGAPLAGIVSAALAVIFNPIEPLQLDREVWMAIDVFAGVYLMTGIAPKVCHQR